MTHYLDSLHGIIGSQILLGIAAGFFPYAAQASVQAATSHEDVATVTGLYMAVYNVGFGVGSAVSGLIMAQIVPGELKRRMDIDRANEWYDTPLFLLEEFPLGTAERDAASIAYQRYQFVVCILSACGCIGLIAFSFCVDNPRLPDTQSLPSNELPQDAERDEELQSVSGP